MVWKCFPWYGDVVCGMEMLSVVWKYSGNILEIKLPSVEVVQFFQCYYCYFYVSSAVHGTPSFLRLSIPLTAADHIVIVVAVYTLILVLAVQSVMSLRAAGKILDKFLWTRTRQPSPGLAISGQTTK